MAEGNWSVIRVEKISAEGAQKTERHNERKNESYANLNVDTEQIARNVHFKDTGGLTYNEYFQRLIDEGKISTRGQKAGATIFNELVVDVNTRYFEEHGGYEYAKQFYEEAYRFGCEIYGEDNIVSAVMHADEINKAVSEELGKPVYHYHLHIVAIPTVRKEILWSKRCKDEALRCTVKEVITSRSEIQDLKSSVSYYQSQYFNASSAVERLQERYDRLKEKCQPFLQALERFPRLVEVFVEKVKELFNIKEAQEREDRAAARKEQSKHRRGRNDWER